METVADYYKKEFDLPGGGTIKSPFKLCTPSKNEPKECAFAKENLITDLAEKKRILEKFGYTLPSHPKRKQQAEDWIEDCPILVLKKGTTLVHSTKADHILSIKEEGMMLQETLHTTNVAGWWKKYYPGQEEYKGGWFTYDTEYGGPAFGIALYYRIEEDIPVLFIPNQRARLNNIHYYPFETEIIQTNKIETDEKIKRYSGSHLIPGVKNWREKKYKEIVPVYYADQLGLRLAKLHFPGYISCDECEVYITHNVMKKVKLNRPYKIKSQLGYRKECIKCSEGLLVKGSDGTDFCPKCMYREGAKEETKEQPEMLNKTIYELIADLLCQGTDCPIKAELEVNTKEKNREDFSFRRLTEEELKGLGLKYGEFMRKCKSVYLSTSGSLFCGDKDVETVLEK